MKRDIIHDTMSLSLEDDLDINMNAGNNLWISEEEAKTINSQIIQLVSDVMKNRHQKLIHFNGNTYKLLFATIPSSSHATDEDDDSAGDMDTRYTKKLLIQLLLGDNKISLTYNLFKHRTSKKWMLGFIGNPTSIMSGHNVSPLVLHESPFQETIEHFRIGFKLLFKVLRVNPGEATRKRLQRGDIGIYNVQWALYMPTQNKYVDLTVLRLLFGRPIIPDRKTFNAPPLSEYLGFSFGQHHDYPNGVMLIKKHGTGAKRKSYLSINFYDKEESLKQKGVNSVSDHEDDTVSSSLRLDITAHRRFLEKLVRNARARALELQAMYPRLEIKLERFIKESATQLTAYTICRAMSILCLDDNMHRHRFSNWLVHECLIKELRLDKLLLFKGMKLSKLDTLTEKEFAIFEAWKESSDDSWRNEFKDKNLSKFCTAIEQKLGVVLDVPYDMLAQLTALDKVYGLGSRKKIDQFITMSETNDNRIFQLMKDSQDDVHQSRASLYKSMIKPRLVEGKRYQIA